MDRTSPVVLRRVLRGALDVLAVLVAVPLALRLLGLERGFPAVPLMTGFAYLPLLSGAVLLGAAAARARRAAVVAGGVAVVSALVLLPRTLPGPAPAVAPTGPEVTVATANLLFGRADADALVDLVDRHAVDVLAVVEVTRGAVDRLVEAGLEDRLPEAVVATGRGANGAAIWSRWPLAEVPLDRLPRSFTQARAEVDVPGAPAVEVTAVHPWPPVDPGAVGPWARSLRGLPAAEEAIVRLLAGDFNATLDHAVLREVLAGGYVDAADAVGAGLVPTFSGIGFGDPVPPVTLDHVLVDDRVAVRALAVEDLPGSDHDLVVSRLRLPAGP